AQGRVAVGVGRAGDGNQRGKFSVAKASKTTGNTGQDVGEHNSWAGIERGGCAREYENSGADDRSDAQSNEVHWSQRPLQTMFAGFRRLAHQHVEGLTFQQIGHSGGASSSRLFLRIQLLVALR